MNISVCENKEEWDASLSGQDRPSFLQSWDWGEFQQAAGHEPMRIVAGGTQAECRLQGFRHNLGLGVSYFYVPQAWNMEHGTWNKILEYIKQQGYAFVRVEPKSKLQVTNYKLQVTSSRQPRNTLVLDLTKTGEQLLDAMHSKTRYNIGLAERKGVVVKEEKNLEVFWRLNKETTGRDKFHSHPCGYYAKMLRLGMVHQLTAEYQGKSIASNLLIRFGDTMTYLHGVSSLNYKEAMAPYLLQWRGIELARRSECRRYDLYGVASLSPKSEMVCFHNYRWDANHRWSGITRFKVGFGGTPVSYGQAVDVVLQPWKYKMYRLVYRMYELRKLRNYELQTVI